MSIKWTQNQQLAINHATGNTLVSAAAGSGKTAVLVERIIQKILRDGCNIDEILALTFTNAAATEMRTRISEAISKKLDENPENSHLRRQLILLDRAQINTIHSFCQTLLRNNAHKIGISPNFSIVSEADLTMLKMQALDEVLENLYAYNDKGLQLLADCFGGKYDDKDLCSIILELHDFANSTSNPQKWLKGCSEKFPTESTNYSPNEYLSENWGGPYIALLTDKMHGIIYMYKQAIKTVEFEEGLENYYEFLCEEIKLFQMLLKTMMSGDWDKTFEMVSTIEFGRLPSKKKNSSEEASNFVKSVRDNAKKTIKSFKSDIFYADSTVICQDLEWLGQNISTLSDIVTSFNEALIKVKRTKNILDFSDLEQLTIVLLQENTGESLVTFNEIFIDEYQDTSQAQAEIFAQLAQNNTFVVGDVKQSIYRFRNADPSLFLQRREDYKTTGTGTNISLSFNFRSNAHILNFINYVFEKIMSKKVGEVDYDESEKLHYGSSSFEEPPEKSLVEFHIVEKKFDENIELNDDEMQIDAITREAQLTASRILQLVEVEKPLVFDKSLGDYRNITYRDIVILSRNTKAVSSIFANEMTGKNIPVFYEENSGFFASIEISIILNLLRIIDNPLQDIPLLSVMRSPIFAFSDDELAELRAENREDSLYSLILDNDSQKCRKLTDFFERYRALSKNITIPILLQTIFAETNYEAYVSAMPNSAVRLANLRLLSKHAETFCSKSYKSIFEFIQYIKTMLDNNYDFPMARFASENDNAVRIMSIHKSKGLEFPVVFLVRCGTSFNIKALNRSILFDIDLGIGADYVDPTRLIKYPTIAKQMISSKRHNELLSEEMRLLYVALTRAINKLIIIGSTSSIEKSYCNWSLTSSNELDTMANVISSGSSYLDWLALSLIDIPESTDLSLAIIHHKAHDIIQSYSRDEFITLPDLATPEAQPADADEDTLKEEIALRLSYKYPHERQTYIPTKFSVSELVNLNNSNSESEYCVELSKPKFLLKRNRFPSALKGTIAHFIMQNIDITKTNTTGEIMSQINDFISAEMISEDFAKQISTESIYQFFSSTLGKRLKSSRNVAREVKFFLEVPVSELMSEYREIDEKILLQGVVDCYFEEDEKIIIIDYKTGKVHDQHKKQLEFYKHALEKILDKKVAESYIVSL